MIYFYTQNRQEIVGATRVKMVPLDGAHRGEANILAKLDRDSVLLGTYSLEKAKLIMDEIYRNVDLIDYAMPEEWGCDEEEKSGVTLNDWGIFTAKMQKAFRTLSTCSWEKKEDNQ